METTSAQLIAEIILQPFNLNFRLHTWLSREPWAKLWYTLRALDQSGKGYYQIPIEFAELLTGGDEKTIYRWLKDGRSAGAFRRYKVRRGILSVWLGGLFIVCQRVLPNCKSWGAVAVVNLLEISKIRALTTATATQLLQQRSRYAANSRLKKEYRTAYGAPHPNELLQTEKQSSLKSDKGQVPFLLHVSDTRVFVSKGFTAFGISQNTISCDLGIHPRTVQRHQSAVGMVKRQLCQSKSEYAQLNRSLEEEASEAWAWSDGIQNKNLGYQTTTDTLTFFDGITPGAKKASVANQWRMPAGDLGRRFFAIGGKQKRWFMAKCNIYREQVTLTTMRASRKAFRLKVEELTHNTVTVSPEGEPAPQGHVLTLLPIPPGNERHF